MRKHGAVARRRERMVERAIEATSRVLRCGISSRKIKNFLEEFRDELVPIQNGLSER